MAPAPRRHGRSMLARTGAEDPGAQKRQERSAGQHPQNINEKHQDGDRERETGREKRNRHRIEILKLEQDDDGGEDNDQGDVDEPYDGSSSSDESRGFPAKLPGDRQENGGRSITQRESRADRRMFDVIPLPHRGRRWWHRTLPTFGITTRPQAEPRSVIAASGTCRFGSSPKAQRAEGSLPEAARPPRACASSASVPPWVFTRLEETPCSRFATRRAGAGK